MPFTFGLIPACGTLYAEPKAKVPRDTKRRPTGDPRSVGRRRRISALTARPRPPNGRLQVLCRCGVHGIALRESPQSLRASLNPVGDLDADAVA